MNRLDQTLARLRGEKRSALATYFTAGDPDFDTSLRLLQGLAAAGADVIELGMPFSDPVADGVVIQAAHLRALAGGQTVRRTLELVARLRETDDVTPVVLMGYFNPVLQYGVERFLGDARRAGVDALLLVDLTVEPAAPYVAAAQETGIHLIRMTAPTTDEARLSTVLDGASGFVYHVSLTGTTGAARSAAAVPLQALARLRRHTDLPLALGFGIREASQIAALAGAVDLIVVGSRLVETLAASGVDGALQQVRDFAHVLR
ncbi:tryptophan synthase subunit alpha [Paludibacterium yongneupense]|uniref:tryptophan synthase subunit alpha n=1 Tax=Paludibacterium yongneupense TaxID=400061 RepID=UPI0003FFDAD7|nr:tryptophan synthase subunit alpha [Paludibacterium yongneupense]